MTKRAKTSQKPDGTGKTLLTDELIEMIKEKLEKGMYIVDACAMFGISREVWYLWLKNAHRDPKAYPMCVKFMHMVQRAEAQSIYEHVNRIENASVMGDWKASAWYLERRHPTKYGRRDHVDLTGLNQDTDEIKSKTEQQLLDEIRGVDAALEDLDETNKKRKK